MDVRKEEDDRRKGDERKRKVSFRTTLACMRVNRR